MADKLIIFDTTLRDGEQSPGASMTKDEKLRIARQLERMRVDVIEAGFAASSRRLRLRSRPLPRRSRTPPSASWRAPTSAIFERAAEALQGANSRPHPHLHRHQPDPHGEEAAHDAGPGG